MIDARRTDTFDLTTSNRLRQHLTTMLHESAGVRVTAAAGVATLWLDFPGHPPNRLDDRRAVEIMHALDAVSRHVHTEILVLRSAKPAGFCAGGEVPSAVLRRLADLPVPSVAYVEGPCLGGGLELVLACQVRLMRACPNGWIGFPGGRMTSATTTRLHRLVDRGTVAWLATGSHLTAREAVAAGLLEDAFCTRRAKIELRTVLDRLQTANSARSQWRWWKPRPRFASPEAILSFETWSGTLGVFGCAAMVPVAAEAAIRGTPVVTDDPAAVRAFLREPYLRGRATPLELEQARDRVRSVGEVTFGVLGHDLEPSAVSAHVGRYTVLAVTGESACDSGHARLTIPELGPMTCVEVEVPAGSRTTEPIRSFFASVGITSLERPATGSIVGRIQSVLWSTAVDLVCDGLPIDVIDAAAAVVCRQPPLRSLDGMGFSTAARFVPRLAPLAAAGLTNGFYHPDHPEEPNALMGLLLREGGVRLHDPDDGFELFDDLPPAEARRQAEDRFLGRLGELRAAFHDDPAWPVLAAAVGVRLPERAVDQPSARRSAA